MEIPDEYIAALIAEEASNLDKNYKREGISAYSKRKSRINKTFARNIIKQASSSKKKVEK